MFLLFIVSLNILFKFYVCVEIDVINTIMFLILLYFWEIIWYLKTWCIYSCRVTNNSTNESQINFLNKKSLGWWTVSWAMNMHDVDKPRYRRECVSCTVAFGPYTSLLKFTKPSLEFQCAVFVVFLFFFINY